MLIWWSDRDNVRKLGASEVDSNEVLGEPRNECTAGLVWEGRSGWVCVFRASITKNGFKQSAASSSVLKAMRWNGFLVGVKVQQWPS